MQVLAKALSQGALHGLGKLAAEGGEGHRRFIGLPLGLAKQPGQQALQLHGLLGQFGLGLFLGVLILLQSIEEAVELVLLEPEGSLELSGLPFLGGQSPKDLPQGFLFRRQITLEPMDLIQLLPLLQPRPGEHAPAHQPSLQILERDVEPEITPGAQGLHPAHLFAQVSLKAQHLPLDACLLPTDNLYLALGLIAEQPGSLHLGPGTIPLQRDALDLYQYALASLLQRSQLLIHLAQAALDRRQLLAKLRWILGALRPQAQRQDHRQERAQPQPHRATFDSPPEAAWPGRGVR